ncbi:MAG: STAS domain-containing protein [Nitrospiraceae bacterium]
MLRLTTHSKDAVTTLKLEGRLAGAWVEELDRCWREVAGTQQSQVVVDLSGVTFIDFEGKALLTRMWQQGAKLHAVGCLTRCIVDEISKSGCPGSSHSNRKDKSKGS